MLENIFSFNFANCDVKCFSFANGAPITASNGEHYYCSQGAEVYLKVHSYVDDIDFGTEYASFYILPNGTIERIVNTDQNGIYKICGSINGFTVSDSNFGGYE